MCYFRPRLKSWASGVELPWNSWPSDTWGRRTGWWCLWFRVADCTRWLACFGFGSCPDSASAAWCGYLRLLFPRKSCYFAGTIAGSISSCRCWSEICSFYVYPFACRLPQGSLLLRFSSGCRIPSWVRDHWFRSSFWWRCPRRFFSGWRSALFCGWLDQRHWGLFRRCSRKLGSQVLCYERWQPIRLRTVLFNFAESWVERKVLFKTGHALVVPLIPFPAVALDIFDLFVALLMGAYIDWIIS